MADWFPSCLLRQSQSPYRKRKMIMAVNPDAIARRIADLLSFLGAGWNHRAIGIETLKPMPWLASEKAKLPMIRLCRHYPE
jgi:hypothetical protein